MAKYQEDPDKLNYEFFHRVPKIRNQIDRLNESNGNNYGDKVLFNHLSKYIDTKAFMSDLTKDERRTVNRFNEMTGGGSGERSLGWDIFISLLFFPFGLIYVAYQRNK